ncbi:MAG: right-handed parallel beta-helix repeat-containing protein, partial [Candidatus Acidiferrales bacterium]
VTARNNLIYHCHTAGVSIGGYAPERGHTEHCSVINNTLYDDDTSGTGSGEFQMQWNMSDNVFANNIVYAGPRCLISVNKSQVDKTHPPAFIDYNLYYCASGSNASTWNELPETLKGFEKYVAATGNDRHSRFLDPRFVDAPNDLHLQSDSPAIATGKIEGMPVGDVDLDGSPRAKSGKIDLGCYQRK